MPISSLDALLRGMEPALAEKEFYFACVDEGSLLELSGHMDFIAGILREEEGLTVIFSADALEEISQLSKGRPIGPFALITLNVNSDLLAVGFLARLSAALAAEGISVNAMSAYHHDHLFVPSGKKDAAMDALRKLSKGTS